MVRLWVSLVRWWLVSGLRRGEGVECEECVVLVVVKVLSDDVTEEIVSWSAEQDQGVGVVECSCVVVGEQGVHVIAFVGGWGEREVYHRVCCTAEVNTERAGSQYTLTARPLCVL